MLTYALLFYSPFSLGWLPIILLLSKQVFGHNRYPVKWYHSFQSGCLINNKCPLPTSFSWYNSLHIRVNHSNSEYWQPNLWYSVWVDNGSRLVDVYLILFFSCMHIWTHPIISRNINYLSLWFLWSWYVSGANVLINLIISRHWKPVTFSHSILWRRNVLLNKCLMILGFCCVTS